MTDKATNIIPPRRATVEGAESRNLQFVAITTSSARTQLEVHMRCRYVTLKAIGADCSFVFSETDAGEVDHTITGASASSTNIGKTLLDGEEVTYELSGRDNWIVVEGSDAGTLQLHASSTQRIVGASTVKP